MAARASRAPWSARSPTACCASRACRSSCSVRRNRRPRPRPRTTGERTILQTQHSTRPALEPSPVEATSLETQPASLRCALRPHQHVRPRRWPGRHPRSLHCSRLLTPSTQLAAGAELQEASDFELTDPFARQVGELADLVERLGSGLGDVERAAVLELPRLAIGEVDL